MPTLRVRPNKVIKRREERKRKRNRRGEERGFETETRDKSKNT